MKHKKTVLLLIVFLAYTAVYFSYDAVFVRPQSHQLTSESPTVLDTPTDTESVAVSVDNITSELTETAVVQSDINQDSLTVENITSDTAQTAPSEQVITNDTPVNAPVVNAEEQSSSPVNIAVEEQTTTTPQNNEVVVETLTDSKVSEPEPVAPVATPATIVDSKKSIEAVEDKFKVAGSNEFIKSEEKRAANRDGQTETVRVAESKAKHETVNSSKVADTEAVNDDSNKFAVVTFSSVVKRSSKPKTDMIVVSTEKKTVAAKNKDSAKKDPAAITVLISEDVRRCLSPYLSLPKYSDDINIKVVTIGSELYAIDRQFTVLKFSNSSCSWSSIKLKYKDKPIPRSEATLNVIDDKIYIFGGWGYGSTYFNDIWYYDTISMMWVNEPSTTSMLPRAYHSSTVHDGDIYVFGGYNGGFLNDLWVFRSDYSRWDRVNTASMPPASGYHKAMLLGDSIYITEGYDRNSNVINDIWVFNTKQSSWRSIKASPGSDRLALINRDAKQNSENISKLSSCTRDNFIDRYGRGYAKSLLPKIAHITFDSSYEAEASKVNADYQYNVNNNFIYENGIHKDRMIVDDTTKSSSKPVKEDVALYYLRPQISIRDR